MHTLEGMLRASLWARDLSDDQFARVENEMVAREFPAGSFVCRTGEPVASWFGIIEGLLKISLVSKSGKSMTLTGVAPGGWFGEGSVLKTGPRGYDAVALRPSKVACMPRSTFRWLCQVSIPFNRFLVTQLNERCGQFIAMLEADRLLDLDARVAQCLWVLFNPVLYPGFGPRIDISQEEIGNLSGVSRQHVNRALHHLEERGLLRVDHRGITVINVADLRASTGGPDLI